MVWSTALSAAAASLCLVPASALNKRVPMEFASGTLTEGRRPEMEIYKAHWWPLEPPPYHHPAKSPTIFEIQAVQALEDNYTAYWRSLPKYPEVSEQVIFVQQKPYFKVPWQSTVTQIIPDRGQGELLFVCHHKTGVNLHLNIQNVLQGIFTMRDLYEPNSWQLMALNEGSKVLHLIRDPVDVILSGYRYHQNHWGSETWSWGHGKNQDPQCFMCDEEDHAVIFDTCNFNCTYFELLNRVDETTGVVLEAVSARTALTSMARGLAAWADRDNVLQISFDLLEAHPTQTIGCILKFLGLSDDTLLAERLEAQTLTVQDPDHVTSGHYNNTLIKEYLESHLWAQDFNELRQVMAKVYKSQATRFGCPIAEV